MSTKTEINLSDYEWGLADMFDVAMRAQADRDNTHWHSIHGGSELHELHTSPSSRAGKADEEEDAAAENYRATGKRKHVLVPSN